MKTDKNGADSQLSTLNHQLAGNGEVKESKATDYNFPKSRRTYVAGVLHPDLRVPFREISLAPTKTMSGEIEVNEPVRVYDTSGPWGDPSVDADVTRGLPPLRAKWILARGDVEEIDGRAVKPIDDGFLSEKHGAERNGQRSQVRFQRSAKNKALRAKPGKFVTQFAYARQGVI